jgi:4-oxalocrotonate tautomerase
MAAASAKCSATSTPASQRAERSGGKKRGGFVKNQSGQKNLCSLNCQTAAPRCVTINPQRNTMPTYHVEMIEGRTIEQKKKLVQEITRISVEVLGGSPDSVDVLITDLKAENWATGGKLWSEPRG